MVEAWPPSLPTERADQAGTPWAKTVDYVWYPEGGIPGGSSIATDTGTGSGGGGTQGTASPVGIVVAYAGTSAPTGWLLCDGSAVDADLFPDLYALTPTTPDLRGRFVLGVSPTHARNSTGGAETVTLDNNSLPIHGHVLNDHTHSTPNHAHGTSGTYHAHTASHSHGAVADSQGSHSHVFGGYIWKANAYGAGAAGGYETPVQVNTGPDGAHIHNITIVQADVTTSGASAGSATDQGGAGTTGGGGAIGMSTAGMGGAHNNMPPYWSLVYIVKAVP